MIAIEKSLLQVEDLRRHTPEQLAELRALLDAAVVGRPDPHRPGFYEVDGAEYVYFILRYPAGDKVLLIAAWKKARR
jgi:acyl-CoA-binding protein